MLLTLQSLSQDSPISPKLREFLSAAAAGGGGGGGGGGVVVVLLRFFLKLVFFFTQRKASVTIKLVAVAQVTAAEATPSSQKKLQLRSALQFDSRRCR